VEHDESHFIELARWAGFAADDFPRECSLSLTRVEPNISLSVSA